MDPKFRSSFIPKKPLPIKSSGRVKQHHSFNLIVFLAGILFLAAIGLTGAAFVYERFIEDRVGKKGIALTVEKNKLNLDNIEAYRVLADRLSTAQTLLNNHKATSKLFEMLNEKTLHNVVYSGFDIKDNVDGTNPKIAISGQATSFNALTVQTDAFKNEDIITDIRFGRISLSEDGSIEFELLADLAAKELLYTGDI